MVERHGHHDGIEGSYDPSSDECFEMRRVEDGMGEQWAAKFRQLVPAPLLEGAK